MSSYHAGDDTNINVLPQVPATATRDDSDSNGFVVVDSPNSKAKARGAPTQLPPPATQGTEDLLDDDLEDESLRPPAFPAANRVKNLPTPPVGQVLPDFSDLMVNRRQSRSPGIEADSSGSVKRKPSVVKKLRDRMVK